MKTIAVLTARADDGEQKSILSGIVQRCFEVGADTFVYSNIYNHWVKDAVLNYENVIYDFFNPAAFAGVIVTAEAFFDKELLTSILERIHKAAVPAVLIGGEYAGFVCIDSKDDADFEHIADHLLWVHGFADIDILTGFKGDPHAEKRVAGCKRAFRKAGIPFRSSKVHYGNFWTDSGAGLARKYLRGDLPLPQAVICTNDQMAFGLCDELVANGVDIPGKLTVTGYEYTDSRTLHYPLLTTYRRGRYELGIEAVNRLFGLPTVQDTTDHMVCGDTCTCGADPRQLGEETQKARIGQHHSVMSSIAQFGNALTACRSLSEYLAVLKNHMYLHHGASRLYLCVSREWGKHNAVCDRYLCCDVHSDVPFEFNKTDIPPVSRGNSDHPMVYCLTPLVFDRHCFGFAALGYNTPQTYDFSFRDWSKTASNALEFLRMKNDILYLKQCQSVSALHDALTGFYHEEEFRQVVGSGKADLRIAVVSVHLADRKDLPGENYMNDMLSSLAAATKKCCRRQEVCGRIGEDTLAILYEASSAWFLDSLKVFASQSLYQKSNSASVVLAFSDLASVDIQHLSAIARQCTRAAAHEHNRRHKLPHHKALSELHHRIMASPGSAPDIAEACNILSLGAGRFRVLYKECFGVSYMQDCIDGRIARAKYLLCTSAMSIFAIAVECGYADEKFFSRQFRNAAGCSPMHYRRSFMR